MAWGRRRRFFCNNRGGECVHALSDRWFSEGEWRRFEGRCGAAAGGCGLALKEGAPQDLRPRWAALFAGGLAAAVVGTVAVREWLFPPPLQHFSFKQPTTDLDPKADAADVTVLRSGALQADAVVRYATRDVSAKAGSDYEAARGTLRFEAGEREKLLKLRVVPDPTFRKPSRRFEVVLENVAGTPSHTVAVMTSAEALTQLARVEQQVRSASNVAKDIADLVFRLEEARSLAAAAQADNTPRAREVLRDTMAMSEQLSGNLVRAREAYAQVLRDLASHDPAVVLPAFDSVRRNLRQQGMVQQADATHVMRQHLEQFWQTRAVSDMDRWVRELRQVIPAAKASPKTT